MSEAENTPEEAGRVRLAGSTKDISKEQKTQMIDWVMQARSFESAQKPALSPGPWWERCNEDQRAAAKAFVAEYLPHLLEAQP